MGSSLGASTLVSLFVPFIVSVLTSCGACAGNRDFPEKPDTQLTPGSYCEQPDAYRYPEQIPYCKRNVESELKRDIIREYNETLGFNIQQKDRGNFKIDHLIPLCAGGSNERSNLWPQHRSIYQVTDPIEQLTCEKMKEGVLTQADAVELIFKVKFDLSTADEVIDQLNAL